MRSRIIKNDKKNRKNWISITQNYNKNDGRNDNNDDNDRK